MARRIVETETPKAAVSKEEAPKAEAVVETKVVKKVEETEEQMIARIMKGNGSSDEYVDKYKKDFPVSWR